MTEPEKPLDVVGASAFRLVQEVSAPLIMVIAKETGACGHRAALALGKAMIAVGTCLVQTIHEDKPCINTQAEATDLVTCQALVEAYWKENTENESAPTPGESVH